jgi:hypothetical protein
LKVVVLVGCCWAKKCLLQIIISVVSQDEHPNDVAVLLLNMLDVRDFSDADGSLSDLQDTSIRAIK